MVIQHRKEERINQEVFGSVNPNSDHFNFELWAKAVRGQMLAALRKRLRSSQPIKQPSFH